MTGEPERILRLTASGPGELAALLAVPNSELLALDAVVDKDAACRLAVVAPTAKRLALARKVVVKGKPWRGRNDVWFSPRPLLADGRRKIAFVFPGLEAEFAPRVGDVADWLGVEPPELRNDTIGSHAASLLAVGRMLDEALRRLAIRPDLAVGHSVGEWSAMICGGIFAGADFDELLRRTDLDALKVPGVEFGVIGCGCRQVVEAIADRPNLVVSHENSTNQTVVCGPPDDIAELHAHFRGDGVICQVLPFRSGFHTPMIRPYLAPFRDGVPSLSAYPATIPVYSTTTCEPFPADPGAIGELCVRHMLEPVRFRGAVLALYAAGARVFLQLGGGQLGSLVDDTLRDCEHLTVAANSAHRGGVDQLRRVAAALWVEGARPRFPNSPRATAIPSSPVSAPPSHADGPDRTVRDAMVELDELAARFPVAAELRALLCEVAESATAVMRVAEGKPPPSPECGPLRVGTATMPYLRDHCLVAQRADWPDEADRMPVVPATTVLAHLMDAAERTVPGRFAVGIDDVRLHRWLAAAPPRDVSVTVRQESDDRVRVVLGEFAEATVLLAQRYRPDSEGGWPAAHDEQPTALRAAELYQQRWLFHGPRFQVVTRSDGIATRAVRGELTATEAPGGLLDGVGQLIGQWLIERWPDRWIAFPTRIDRIRLHAALPPVGTRLDCSVRIRSITDDTVAADARLTLAGRVVISIDGWHDRRFDSDERAGAMHRYPELNTLAEPRGEGWWLLAERSPSLASREFYLRKYLDRLEWAEYLCVPPRSRRQWQLRRIVVKDAVRGWLWEHGAGPLFPAEIAMVDDEAGRCVLRGRHGLALPELVVAVAGCREIAVARVTAAEPGAAGGRIEVVELPAAVAVRHHRGSVSQSLPSPRWPRAAGTRD